MADSGKQAPADQNRQSAPLGIPSSPFPSRRARIRASLRRLWQAVTGPIPVTEPPLAPGRQGMGLPAERGLSLQWVTPGRGGKSISAFDNWFLERVCRPSAERYPALARLRAKLLEFGGIDVAVHPAILLDAAKFVKRGKRYEGEIIEYKGPRWMCACNATLLLLSGLAERVWFGFALDENRVWYVHCANLSKDGQLIENAEPATVYFGVALTPEEAKKFVSLVLCGPVFGVLE